MWVPATHAGQLDWIFGSLLKCGPVLDVVGIWGGSSEWDFSLSLYFSSENEISTCLKKKNMFYCP